MIDDAVVMWYSRKQKSIVLSTTESELISATTAVKELIGLHNIISSIFPWICFTKNLYGDNNACTAISRGNASTRKVRHLVLGELYIRQAVEREGCEIHRVDTLKNPSDILTKILGKEAMERLRPFLGLIRFR